MRRSWNIYPGLLAAGLLIAPLAAAADGDAFRVGVVFDGPASITEQLFGQVKREILTLTAGEFDVRFEDEHVLYGEWTVASIHAAIEALLADPEVDLILALGPLSSQTFCCREPLPKPVIAAIVVDAQLQDLPEHDGASGVHNLNYLTFPASFERDVELFAEIVPFSKLTVVFNQWFLDVVPQIGIQILEILAEKGIGYDIVAVGDSVDEALAAIPEDAEAIYMAPLLHLSDAERDRFIGGLEQRRLPSFSIFGVAEVALGVLAGQRDHAFYDRLARRIALNVQRILLGEDAGAIPVAVPDRRRLTLNMDTVRATGVWPPWHLLTEADLLNEKPASLPLLTIAEAVERAVAANLDLAAATRDVAAGAQVVRRARAALRPRIDAALSAVQIDGDRASNPFAVQAERAGSTGLTLTQLIYSDPALANVRVQGHAQLSREQELEQLRLDLVQETLVTYMSVLLAQTLEEIRKSNLELSRSNLDLAQVRRAVGSAGPGEVYRWESEVATARRDLVTARADSYQARIALNRLLHRRLEEGFRTEAFDLESVLDGTPGGAPEPVLFRNHQQVMSYTRTPRLFEVFRRFMVEEGLERAPELAQLDAAIAAAKRIVTTARRAFWSPEVALSGQLDHVLGVGGEVSDVVAGSADTSWSLALAATLPLFSGGARRAEAMEAEETLAALELQRRALAERLDQLIRSELYQANAAFSGIQLTRQAAAAAAKNLELVTDAYSRGVVDVLDLLDAQNASLQAELASASALFEFFIDLIDAERAVNWFEIERSPQEQAAWFSRLDEYFRDHGLKPRPEGRREER